MHILHTESSCGWGGQEIRILTESAGMVARGHRVSLIAPASSNIYAVAEHYGIEPIALPIERKQFSALLAMRRWGAMRARIATPEKPTKFDPKYLARLEHDLHKLD